MNRILVSVIALLISAVFSVHAYAAKTVFADGDKAQGIQGTKVTAVFLNGLQTHRHDGLDQDGSAPTTYAQDTGTANAMVLALTPALTAHITGMPIYAKAANANTGACTVNINGLGAKAIKDTTGNDPPAGAIAVGAMLEIVYNGTNYIMVSANIANNHVTDVSGNVHGATQSNLANMIVKRDASGNFSAGTITATLNGSATSAGNSTNLGGQSASYYQAASTAITTSNIGSQSVSYASSAGAVPWSGIGSKPFSYSGQSGQPSWLWGTNDGSSYLVWNPANFNVYSATYASYLNGQPGSYYQSAASAITTSNIGSQSVNYANSAGSTSSATSATYATYLNSQPGSFYTNASNLSSGTISDARLSSNVPLTSGGIYNKLNAGEVIASGGSSSMTVSGLDGNNDYAYEIIFEASSGTNNSGYLLGFRINGDTGGNYGFKGTMGNGGNQTMINLSHLWTYGSVGRILLRTRQLQAGTYNVGMEYTCTENGPSDFNYHYGVGAWTSGGSNITSVTIFTTDGSNFIAGSRMAVRRVF